MDCSDAAVQTQQYVARVDRMARIVKASYEVFTEFSFQDATTGEIARRAQVSKRDIYADFPDKHSLLIAAMNKLLKEVEEKLSAAIAEAKDSQAIRRKLETVGFVLVEETLSVSMSVITRHVTSESISRPLIGTIYFENGPAQRSRLVSKILSSHLNTSKSKAGDAIRAGEDYLALVAHQPLLTTLIGMQHIWTQESIRTHVTNAVDSFLLAYPGYA